MTNAQLADIAANIELNIVPPGTYAAAPDFEMLNLDEMMREFRKQFRSRSESYRRPGERETEIARRIFCDRWNVRNGEPTADWDSHYRPRAPPRPAPPRSPTQGTGHRASGGWQSVALAPPRETMGNRANVLFTTPGSPGQGIGVYTHWNGHRLAEAVATLTEHAPFKQRLGDYSYARRIAVQFILEALGADTASGTGHGIYLESEGTDDGGRTPIVVCLSSGKVR